jgi:hypothetical protein
MNANTESRYTLTLPFKGRARVRSFHLYTLSSSLARRMRTFSNSYSDCT